MTTEMTIPFEKEYLASFSKDNNEPEWLAALRLRALTAANELPMPKPDKTKIDKWNFTDIATHVVKGESISDLGDLPEELNALINKEKSEHNLYIQRNNQAAYLSLTEEAKKQGVIFLSILDAMTQHPDLVEKYFMTDTVKVNENKLTALHAALLNGGVFLYIPRNVIVEEPIHAVFHVDDANANLFNHVLIVAEANSAVTYVENYLSTVSGSTNIANIIAEVIVQDNAQVTYGAVDYLSDTFTTYVNRQATVARDGKIEWALGLMNDGNTISENVTNLMGDGSIGDTKTVVVGRGKQTQNFTTKIVHFGKNSQGHILKHGVMKDEASSVFNGIGKIEHGATKSDSQQESRVLMLSEKARGDANPMLLIDEDDVIAGHAASVGRVDPVQLYYLMSRGIRQSEAERLVIHGFLAPVVNQLPIEEVKKQLIALIERKVQ